MPTPSALRNFKAATQLKLAKGSANFADAASTLLHRSILSVRGVQYRIREVEFYLHSEEHRDPYVFCHPEQLQFGAWHIHRAGSSASNSPKGGKFKGIDLTLGENGAWAGALIRSIEKVDHDAFIEGPSLVVDAIMKELGVAEVRDLLMPGVLALELLDNPSPEPGLSLASPRVGISHRQDLPPEAFLDFLFSPYRFLARPDLATKGRHQAFLAAALEMGKDAAAHLFEISEKLADRHLERFEAGTLHQPTDFLHLEKLSVPQWCEFYGSYREWKRKDSIASTTPATLLALAVKQLMSGDFPGLFTTCGEGLNASQESKDTLEFLRLRSVALGSMGRHNEARVNLLEALAIDPADGITLANYITSCLACGDPESATGALEIYFDDLDGQGKSIALESVEEAIQSGSLEPESLPLSVIEAVAARLKKAV